MGNETEQIEVRLKALELRMRRYRIALVVALGANLARFLAPGSLMAAKTPEVVIAKRFVVVDDANTVRVALTVENDGPDLTLYDAAGNGRAKLTVFKDGPRLALSDAAGKLRSTLGVDKDGSDLALYDAAGELRAAFSIFKGQPGLVLYDAAGKAGATLTVDKDGPDLTLFDTARKIRAILGATDVANIRTEATERRPESSLVLLSHTGKVLWSAP